MSEISSCRTEQHEAPVPPVVTVPVEQIAHTIAQRAFQLFAMETNVSCNNTDPDEFGIHIHQDAGQDPSTVLLDAFRIHHTKSNDPTKRRHVSQTLCMSIAHDPDTNDVTEQWLYSQQPKALSGSHVEDLQRDFLTFISEKLTAIGNRSRPRN